MAKPKGHRRVQQARATGGSRHRREVSRRGPATLATAAAIGFAMWTSAGVASADEGEAAIADIWDRLPAEAQSALQNDTTPELIAAAAAEDAQEDAIEAAEDLARDQERAAEQSARDAEQAQQLAADIAHQDAVIAEAMAIHNAAVAQGQADWEAQHNPPPPAPESEHVHEEPAHVHEEPAHVHEAPPPPPPAPSTVKPVAYDSGSDHGHWTPGVSTTAFASALANEYGLNLGSGYRDPGHNASVGGSPTSDHMKGDPDNPGAWDIPCDTSNPNCDALAEEAVRSGVPQVLWRVDDHYDHVHLGFGNPYV